MSKISVFKFNINNNEFAANVINQLIGNYLNTRGFFYNADEMCYKTGSNSKQGDIKNVALSLGASAVTTMLTGGSSVVAISSIQHGFEYQINGNQLIIKAYLINKNGKQFIHSTFNNSKAASYYYGDLQGSLFKELKNNNIILVGKEIEKIKDGSEFKVAKVLLIYFLVMILLVVVVFMFMFN